ncbi:hypothetical protein DB30_01412 [Enhygromyxa salina]|uniref:Uncharacterized protein n=1 Tax=Enhygromyxa salina TaxID=215803 RepID=A0A0C2A4K1_9BACT|nr:hypothetical protein DB30_01412 [Enhygromyxa salina]
MRRRVEPQQPANALPKPNEHVRARIGTPAPRAGSARAE